VGFFSILLSAPRKMTRYDAIVIGAGHNGLVAAAYLARAGRRTLVLERRDVVGGACVTETGIFPGYKVSTAAYVNSLFRPEIVDELKLRNYGFETIERDPASFSPFLDGRYLFLSGRSSSDRAEIAKFSGDDAVNFPRYEAMLRRVASVIEPLLDERPPNVARPALRDWLSLGRAGLRLRRLGPTLGETVEMLAGAARPILDRWFQSEELKATLATDAIIGAFAAPSMPGTAYVLFHHVMGETNGKKGVWSYVHGGMGGLTQALAQAATALGAEILTEREVVKILVRGGAASGVVLSNGDEFRAGSVASGVDCRLTFERFLEPNELPPEFLDEIRRIDYRSASLKINLALAELPNFTAYPGASAGPQHRGTIHLCPNQDYIERAYDDAKYGRPSAEPVVECTIPSSLDPTVAPPGKHLMSMFCQYAPYALMEGAWDERTKDAFANRCFDLVERYAPGFKGSILDRQVLSPPDIEKIFNLTGGNIFQGAMNVDNLYALRPVAGYAGYSTPIRNLYLCGAAAHPGGGVMGAAGRNAAREMLRKR
jgi:phytoene dehydrogenase-like protein